MTNSSQFKPGKSLRKTIVDSAALAVLLGFVGVDATVGDTVQYRNDPAFYPQVGSALLHEFGTASFPPLAETTQTTYLVPGTGPVNLTYRFKYDTGGLLFSFGHYRITPALNAIDRSTDAGKQAYAIQALAPGSATLIFDDALDGPGAMRTVSANGGDTLGFFFLPDAALAEFQTFPNRFALNGTGSATYREPPPLRWPFFGDSDANPGGLDQLMSFSGVSGVTGAPTNLFAWEDLTRLDIPGNFFPTDNQFNDLIFAIEAAQTTPVPVPEPIAHWPLDNNPQDIVGGRNGTLMGDAKYSTDVPAKLAAVSTHSLALDGALDKLYYDVQAGDAETNEFTLSLWVKNAKTDWYSAFFGTRSPSEGGFDAKFDRDQRIYTDIGDQTSLRSTYATPRAVSAAWRHIAIAVKPGLQTVYVDGELFDVHPFSSDFMPVLFDANHDIAIGAIHGNSNDEDFRGLIDDVRIFGRALTAAEVRSVFNVVPELVPGDYNRDFVVDAADYLVWRDQLGELVEQCSGADANCNGFIDNLDYQTWRHNYGRSALLGAVSSANVSLAGTVEAPEATSLLLLASGIALAACNRAAMRRLG